MKRLPLFDSASTYYIDGVKRINVGLVKLKNGAKYEGEWILKNDKYIMDGHGVCLWPSGERYNGYWKNHKRNGRGKYMYPNGDVYEGEFKDDKRHGTGNFTNHDGSRYEGDWFENKPHGLGFTTFDDNVYEGQWLHGKMHGKGKVKFSGNATYIGDLRDF